MTAWWAQDHKYRTKAHIDIARFAGTAVWLRQQEICNTQAGCAGLFILISMPGAYKGIYWWEASVFMKCLDKWSAFPNHSHASLVHVDEIEEGMYCILHISEYMGWSFYTYSVGRLSWWHVLIQPSHHDLDAALVRGRKISWHWTSTISQRWTWLHVVRGQALRAWGLGWR